MGWASRWAAIDWGVYGVPETFVISKDGVIVHKHIGPVSADELQMLREKGEAELQEPGRWGTTFTLLQCWGRL